MGSDLAMDTRWVQEWERKEGKKAGKKEAVSEISGDVNNLHKIVEQHQNILKEMNEANILHSEITEALLDRLETLERRVEEALEQVVLTAKNRLDEVHRLRAELGKDKNG